MEKRWLLRVGPPIVALSALGLVAGASAGAVEERWEPPDCGGGGNRTAVVALRPAPRAPNEIRGESWFRLDPVLDATGTLAGQRLEIGVHGRAVRRMALPPESFGAGPYGGIVLVGSDDGRRSVLRAMDASAGCAALVARERSVIRRAVLDPAGTTVYEFRVDRASRADLGVWRRPLGGGPAKRVLAPLGDDDRFGRTFSTELSWSVEGDRLAVAQCGQTACRVRLLEPATGRVRMIARPDLGELVGVTADRVVTYAACRGIPCPILSTDADGLTEVVAPTAGIARLMRTDDGPRLVHEVVTGERVELHVVDPAGDRPPVEIAGPGDGLRLAPDSARAAAGLRVPEGWALLAPDARPGASAVLVRIADGTAVSIPEVTR